MIHGDGATILVAPDSFKESLAAAEAAEAIASGVRDALPEAPVDICPVADGGEGTVEALVAATQGALRRSAVTGPRGERLEATWGMLGDGATAVIEMAAAAGLMLVPLPQRDPTRTTTFGVGELIRAAIDRGAQRIIVGIGGSATTDGGAGMAQALGVRFIDAGGAVIERPMTGGLLAEAEGLDASSIDKRLARVEVVVACDVTNPLIGEEGAAAVYGPQKGATPSQVAALDAALGRLASWLPNVEATAPGMGAAGGLGFGLVAFCGAALRRGIDLVLDAVRFDERVRRARLVLTGEGRLDGQSIRGKTCIGVAQAAARRGVPTVALVGSLGPQVERTLEHGLRGYHALVGGGVTVERAMAEPAVLLRELAARVVPQYVG